MVPGEAGTAATRHSWIRSIKKCRSLSSTQHGVLQKAAEAKREKYQDLLATLLQYKLAEWEVLLFPLPVGVRVPAMEAMEALHIPDTKHVSLMQQAALALARALQVHMLHISGCQHKNSSAPAAIRLAYKRREYAKEV